LTVHENGTQEYYFDDGARIYSIEPNGAVTCTDRSGERTIVWAKDGSAASRDSFETILQDRLVQNDHGYSYTSPDNFIFNCTSDCQPQWDASQSRWSIKPGGSVSLQNETGTRKINADMSLVYTDSDGMTQTYTNPTIRTSKDGESTQYQYPDGTELRLSKDRTLYVTIPQNNETIQHFWVTSNTSSGGKEPKSPPLVYFREAPRNEFPTAGPDEQHVNLLPFVERPGQRFEN
jgi:hypothetical protein